MITPSLRLSLFLRSFLVQGSWNYRTLIGTGLGWALLPVSARLDPDEPKALVPSDVDDPFNSHPYLTPLALGLWRVPLKRGRISSECEGFGMPFAVRSEASAIN